MRRRYQDSPHVQITQHAKLCGLSAFQKSFPVFSTLLPLTPVCLATRGRAFTRQKRPQLLANRIGLPPVSRPARPRPCTQRDGQIDNRAGPAAGIEEDETDTISLSQPRRPGIASKEMSNDHG